MEPQKPSVGRIVHWVSNKGEHQAAIITRIDEVGGVYLAVFPPYDEMYREHIVTFDEETKNNGTWHWPEKI